MSPEMTFIESMVRLAGWGQLALVAASTAIPRVLNWNRELAPLSALTRRLFWVYAGYIFAFNTLFGLVSAFAPAWLLEVSPLSAAVCGCIALYWGARVIVQFACFGSVAKPTGARYRLAEAALVILFVSLTLTYSIAFASRWWSTLG